MTSNVSSWCSNCNITTFAHSWNVQNFSYCKSKIESPTFSLPGNSNLEWLYRLDPKHFVPLSGKTCVKLDVVVKSCQGLKQLIIKAKAHNGQNNITFNEQVVKVEREGVINCFCRKKEGLFCENSITFEIEVIVVEEYTCQTTSNSQIIEPQSKLVDNFAHLLEDGEFSDVKIIVKGQSFSGHKAILAARSTVFRAMFKNEMIESKQNHVRITDIEPKVFAEMLRFIYTDSVEDLNTNALGLLQAADKYDLEKLKAMCEKALCGSISEKTVIEMLITADLYRAEQLKRATIGFIKRNSDIMSSEIWKSFWAAHFDLATKTMLEMLKLN